MCRLGSRCSRGWTVPSTAPLAWRATHLVLDRIRCVFGQVTREEERLGQMPDE
jgi:hypothetical protein